MRYAVIRAYKLLKIKHLYIFKFLYPYLIIRIGLVARISRSHRGGRGSIPRYGNFF